MTSPIRYEFQLDDYTFDETYRSLYVTKAPFLGDKGNDTLVGNNKDNTLIGKAGDDILIGNEGSDVLNGGKGNDLVEFSVPTTWWEPSFTSKGVYADLNRGIAKDFYGGRDNLVSIEHVWATHLDDEIIGNDEDNDIVGGRGNDKILGGKGNDLIVGGEGEDFLIGGKDNDTFLYRNVRDGGDRIHGSLHQESIDS